MDSSLAQGAAGADLETEEHALKRGARIYCELVSGATTADAFHLTAPLPVGLVQPRYAHDVGPGEPAPVEIFDYICAHGTSTTT